MYGFPWWLNGKESACNAGATGDSGSIPESRRSPGGGHGNPLQYSCLENPMDRGAWQATVHRVTESDMTRSDLAHPHECTMYVWPSKITSTELPHLLPKGWGTPPVYYSQLIDDTAVLEDVDSVLILSPVGERGWDVGKSFNRLGPWPAASTALCQAPPPPPHICLPSSRTLNAAEC